jgi:hypothetical protein
LGRSSSSRPGSSLSCRAGRARTGPKVEGGQGDCAATDLAVLPHAVRLWIWRDIAYPSAYPHRRGGTPPPST